MSLVDVEKIKKQLQNTAALEKIKSAMDASGAGKPKDPKKGTVTKVKKKKASKPEVPSMMEGAEKKLEDKDADREIMEGIESMKKKVKQIKGKY